MLTAEDELFLQYWSENRLKKKRLMFQLSAGLPLGVGIVLSIVVNLLSGWYGRADMEFFSSNGSLLIVLMISALMIVGFTIYVSSKHRWDINEKRYLELLNQKNKSI
jgi:membrane protein YdbS with pleckstrin-like domain